MLDESNSKCLSTFQPGRSLFRTSLLLLNNKYRSLSSERHLSSIIQRGFLDVRMHCFHNALSLYSVVKVLSLGAWPPGSSSSFLSKQPSVIRRPRSLSPASGLNRCLGVIKRNLYKNVWHPPILPYRLQHSTVGRTGLNRRVRDGNGCGPCAHRHQTNLTFSFSNT